MEPLPALLSLAFVHFQDSNSAGVYVIGMGVISVGTSIWVYVDELSKLKTWEKTTGTVDSINLDKDGDRIAFIKYKDKNGVDRSFSSGISDADALGLGSDVQLAFDPSDPGATFISAPKHIRNGAIVGTVIGLALIAVGVYTLLDGPR